MLSLLRSITLVNEDEYFRKEREMVSKKGTLVTIVIALMVVFSMALVACAPGEDALPETGGELPAEAVLEAQRVLSDQLGVSVENIQIVSTEQVEWPDACLGLAEEGEVCAQVITPGWDITFEVNGQEYEVRTDDLGQTVRFVQETLQ